MNILIVGDSFAADWTVKYPEQKGWPNLLAAQYPIKNLAQAGCSEYKIWKQLSSEDISKYSHIIVSHTSPYRIPVKAHPLHKDDPLHCNCDLIYLDVKESGKLPSVVDYFENYFDTDYGLFVHNLIIEKEIAYLKNFTGNVIHITNLDWNHLIKIENFYSFGKYFKKYQGLMNHYNDQGNQLIYNKIKGWIDNDG